MIKIAISAGGVCGEERVMRLTSSGSVEQMARQAAAGDGDADDGLRATFRYFVGFHSRALRCASAI